MSTAGASADGRGSQYLDGVIERACSRVAPTWPLDRSIAVNPFWSMIDMPVSQVAARLASLSGAQLLMPRDWYREAYRDGRLRDEHLAAALLKEGSPTKLSDLLALLEADEPPTRVRARVIDVVDAGRDLGHQMSWRAFVAHSVSQFCAAYFDEGQASLGPHRDGGLYASWRRRALDDHSPSLLMGLQSYKRHVRELPLTARSLIEAAVEVLEVPTSQWESYLWGLLLDQNGWASWCAYRRWTARMAGADDDTISDLLAIRLAWELMLHREGGDEGDVARRWQLAIRSWPEIDAAASTSRQGDWCLQTAMEIAWRTPVLRALRPCLRTPRTVGASVQAVFCIDVRSEVFRRALEAASPSIRTLGFAGFFGLPLEYQPIGLRSRPQLPGLLSPRLRAGDTGLGADVGKRQNVHLDLAASWKSLRTDPLSTFSFVEALGPAYAGELLVDSLGLRRARAVDCVGLSEAEVARRKPRLIGLADGGLLGLDARCELAEAMLRAMSLTRDFARLVLLAGHGSATRNNPYASGLDCGACCGQTGEVNARAAAALLNEPEVRRGLAQRGVTVPDSTCFIAGLHNTTTDETTLFDLDELPASHRVDVATLTEWLAEAGARTRTERAATLGLLAVEPSRLKSAIRSRTTDWAQVRPEWGLANNAAFVVAPREHCRELSFEGRSFLHEYRYEEDREFAVLESIMTAPMLVTHWINFQYYASTVDNTRYGSGNKVLHNVVGGHLGVFEGNGGDLRFGLPLQSIHDGERWVHTPLRLSVFIEAPAVAIEAVLHKHASVRTLVENEWLTLFRLDEKAECIFAYHDHHWVPQPVEAE